MNQVESISDIYEFVNERKRSVYSSLDVSYETDLPDNGIKFDQYLGDRFKSPIWSFPANSFKIEATVSPVTVEISKGEQLYFAENQNLMIFASGETLNEAIKEFIDEFIYTYEFYNKTPDKKLNSAALDLKNKFNKLFQIVYYEARQKKS